MGAGTFSRIYIHIVFTVKRRQRLISGDIENEIFKYISGIVKNKGHKLLAINGMPDHVHLLIGIKPIICISDLVREIKKSSTKYINEQGLTRIKFQWQEGYGAFSCCYQSYQNVVDYIKGQKEHHKKLSFRDEYIRFLKEDEISFDERYLFGD